MAMEFVTEAFILLGFAILFVGLRVLSRWTAVKTWRSFEADDYLAIVAICLYAAETATAYVVGAWYHGLANNGMADAEREALDPSSTEYTMRVLGSQTQMIGWNIYTLLLWVLKACLLVFYSRLLRGVDSTSKRINAGYFILIATYMACALSINLGCRPYYKNWQINPNPGTVCQPGISPVDCIVILILNIATDAYLMSIALPVMWEAKLQWTRKGPIIFMFSGGFLVMAFGTLRCVLILTDPIGGAQSAGAWAVRETFVSIIVTNLPIVYHLGARVTRTVQESTRGGSKLSQQDPSTRQIITIGSIGKKVRSHRGMYTIDDGSEETLEADSAVESLPHRHQRDVKKTVSVSVHTEARPELDLGYVVDRNRHQYLADWH